MRFGRAASPAAGRMPSRGWKTRQSLVAVVAISIVAALGMSAGLLGAQPDLTDQFIADGSQDAPGSWSLLDGILSIGQPQYAFAQTSSEEHFVTKWRISSANQTVTIPVHSNLTYNYIVIWGDGTNSTGVTGNATRTYAMADDYEVRIYGTYPGIYLNNHVDAFNLVSIDQWGTNQWTTMESAFKGASIMVYNATDTPDLSGVTNMSEMFLGATVFNGDISDWDVSKVTNMSNMFNMAIRFNQPLNDWNVSEVTSMNNMFFNAEVFNGNISSWDVSAVDDMSSMFQGAVAFNGDISDWDVSEVTNMSKMFGKATIFNGDISDWDVSKVTNMSNMFQKATVFNGDISDWDVSEVTNMSEMFLEAKVFNGDISDWDVSKVAYMSDMFSDSAFEQNLGKWYVTLNSTSIHDTAIPGVVGSISTQNSYLNDNHFPEYMIGTGGNSTFFEIARDDSFNTLLNMTSVDETGSLYTVNVTTRGVFFGSHQHHMVEITVTGDERVPPISETLKPIGDASSRKKSSSSPPAVHLSALIQTRTVDIPPHIAEQVTLHDASDPLEPLISDGTFDFPLVINGYNYLLDDATNTLVPQTVRAGDDSTTYITFTVYTQRDLAHFTLYLNLQEDDTNYANSDTYITYKNDGTTSVTDPHGYIGSATITVTQEDDSVPEKKTVRITVEFAEPMGPTNMVAYMWDTNRKATLVRIIDAFEVTAALLESDMQAADPESATPDYEPVATDPEPSDMSWPDDYDDAQVLHIIRMWSGFEAEFITDAQLIELLGLEDYQDVDLPDWTMTQLGVLVANGDVTVGEFMLALQYVLEHA